MEEIILNNIKKLKLGLEKFLKEEAKNKLRGKQTEVFEKFNNFTDEQIAKSYLKLPTGFGKTVLFAHIADAFIKEINSSSNKKVVVLVPRINLISQTDDKFAEHTNNNVSYFYGRQQDISKKIIVATYQSLNKLLKYVKPEDVELIIADEAHHALGNKTKQILKNLQNYTPMVGFTATPEYSSKKNLKNLLPTEIYSMTIEDAVRSDMLVPVKNILLKSSIKFDLSQIQKKTDGNFDYNKITKEISIETLEIEIAKLYLNGGDEYAPNKFYRFYGKKAMVTCPSVEIAKEQAKKINELAGKNIAIAFYDGMNNFDEEKKKFKSGNYLVACQINTLTEGFDDTEVSIGINYPTASAVREEQSSGRALRLSNENKNKVAYIIDTVFTADNIQENPYETAYKAGQVLFVDIAGKSILKSDTRGFDPKTNDSRESLFKNRNVKNKTEEIPEYTIITETEELLKLFHDSEIGIKDEEWYSSNDLGKLLGGNHKKYKSYLEQTVNMPEFKDTVKLMQSGSFQTLCIHKDALELFKQTFGIKEIQRDLLKKTENWYSSKDLGKLLGGSKIKYKSYLEQAVNMPEFENTVKLMQSGSKQALCLHEDGLELFKEVFVKVLPKKTEDWYSSADLSNLLGGSNIKYADYLEQAVNMPEFKDVVKLMQSGPKQPLCLHKDGLELFKETFDIKEIQKDLPKKTENWYSSVDLSNLLGGSNKKYVDYLEQAVKMPEFKDVVKLMQSGPFQPLCLHKDGLELFKDTFKIKEIQKDLPKKTENWYSSNDLGKLLGGNHKKYKRYLEQAFNMPEFENTVKLVQSGQLQQPLCLHEDGLELFKEVFVKVLPKKTEDWYSSADLSNLLVGSNKKYADYLEQAVKMPEFKDTVKLMQSGSLQTLCIHKDALELFIQRLNIKIRDPEMFEKATQKLEQKIASEDPVINIEPITDISIVEHKNKKQLETVEGRIKSSDKKIIKNAHNNTCMCCNVNYSANTSMLEVHHKQQFKDLNVGEKRTLHLSDFFTLCADCHDSIHQLKDVGDEGLKQLRWWYKKNEFTEEFDEKQYNKENNILNVKQNER